MRKKKETNSRESQFKEGKRLLQERLNQRNPDKLNQVYLDQYFRSSEASSFNAEEEKKVSQRSNFDNDSTNVHIYGSSPAVSRINKKMRKDFSNSLSKDFSVKRIQSLYRSIDKDIGIMDPNEEFMLIMENRKIEHIDRTKLGKNYNLERLK